ncbi:unnamed protein product [Oikopleura dioica]|uniref:Uncharacterized protein n=1 Tax=Oikopleura dioica TaxID=34765 RepID=E4XJX6_OIKDI|nr:unnamed protein product [Oikopleura dioica]
MNKTCQCSTSQLWGC